MLRPARARGFTVIELMVGLALMAALMFIAIPTFTTWLQNIQIRAASDAFLNGLQLARAEAVRRNQPVRFQLTSTLDNSCALSTAGTNWVVSLDSAVGSCGAAPSADTAAIAPPRIVQARSSNEGSRNAVVASNISSLTFNGLGRPVGGVTLQADISNPTGGACSPGGQMRCMRLLVSTTGQVRMCDPSLISPTPGAC